MCIGAQVLGALEHQHLREIALQPVDDRRAVGIHHHLRDLRAGQQGLDNVLVEWLARQRAIVFARHTLRVVAHGDEGDKIGHREMVFQVFGVVFS